MKTRALVTGAQGFCGRYLVADWLSHDPEVELVGLGRSPRNDDTFTHEVHWGHRAVAAPLTDDLARAARDPRYRYVSLDLHDRPSLTRLLQEFRPTHVVHLAAALRDEPVARLFDANVDALVSLLEAIKGAAIDVRRVVLGSSGSVYGNPSARHLPIPEDAPCAPVDLHAVSKVAGEQVSRIVAAQHALPVVWARIFNPAGPGQDERHLCGRLAQQAAAIAAGALPPQLEVGPLTTTRDFVDVRDVARALRLLAEAPSDVNGNAYNVGSGREDPTEQVLTDVLRFAGIEDSVRLVRLPGRPADIPRHFADISRMRALGYAVRHTLSDSLRDVVAYYAGPVRAVAERLDSAVAVVRADAPLHVSAPAQHGYDVVIEAGLFERIPARLAAMFPGARVAVLCDETVHGLYGERLLDGLRAEGITASSVVVPDGERSKTLERFWSVIESLHGHGVDRRAVLVTLGGGMVTDLGGFVASAYLRGIAYVNVPTTLLAQHDSAVGGKVAINARWAKNFVGAFHHPRAVFTDPSLLATLGDRDISAGVAEAIKVAILAEPALFDILEAHVDGILVRRDVTALTEVVRRATACKIAMLAPDPYEVDLRRGLNLGHTYGHPIETEMEYVGLLHGEAVAFGIAVATVMSLHRGLIASADADRILALLHAYRLPPPIPRERLARACERMDEVRLVRGRSLNFVLPTRVGGFQIVAEIERDEVPRAVEALAKHALLGPCVAP